MVFHHQNQLIYCDSSPLVLTRKIGDLQAMRKIDSNGRLPNLKAPMVHRLLLACFDLWLEKCFGVIRNSSEHAVSSDNKGYENRDNRYSKYYCTLVLSSLSFNVGHRRQKLIACVCVLQYFRRKLISSF